MEISNQFWKLVRYADYFKNYNYYDSRLHRVELHKNSENFYDLKIANGFCFLVVKNFLPSIDSTTDRYVIPFTILSSIDLFIQNNPDLNEAQIDLFENSMVAATYKNMKEIIKYELTWNDTYYNSDHFKHLDTFINYPKTQKYTISKIEVTNILRQLKKSKEDSLILKVMNGSLSVNTFDYNEFEKNDTDYFVGLNKKIFILVLNIFKENLTDVNISISGKLDPIILNNEQITMGLMPIRL